MPSYLNSFRLLTFLFGYQISLNVILMFLEVSTTNRLSSQQRIEKKILKVFFIWRLYTYSKEEKLVTNDEKCPTGRPGQLL